MRPWKSKFLGAEDREWVKRVWVGLPPKKRKAVTDRIRWRRDLYGAFFEQDCDEHSPIIQSFEFDEDDNEVFRLSLAWKKEFVDEDRALAVLEVVDALVEVDPVLRQAWLMSKIHGFVADAVRHGLKSTVGGRVGDEALASFSRQMKAVLSPLYSVKKVRTTRDPGRRTLVVAVELSGIEKVVVTEVAEMNLLL